MYQSSAFIYVALVLLVLTLGLNSLARWLVTSVRKSMSTGTVPKRTAVPIPKGTVVMHREKHQHVSKSADKPKVAIKHYSRIVRAKNVLAKYLCVGAAMLAIASLFFIFSFVIYKGIFSINIDFFTKVPGPSGTRTGMLAKRHCRHAGTLVAMAALFGVPVGMLCGIYLSEYAKPGKFSDTLRMIVDVLAGTPSIIVGVLAYQLLVKTMGGYSGIAGAVALAFLMCPIIARTNRRNDAAVGTRALS